MSVTRAVLLLLVAAGCAGGDDLVARIDGRTLELEIRSTTEGEQVVFAGRPWTGADALTPPTPDIPVVLRVVDPRPLRRLPAAEGDVETLSIPLRELADLPDPCALQLVTFDGRRAVSAADAVVVERRRSEPRVVSFARATLGNALIRGAAVVGLPLLLLVVLAFVRWRTPTATQVRGLLALAIVAVVVARILADPTRTAVERGLAAPPLVWPSDWSFEDDVHERTLGPGFRELVEATAEARRDDEPVLVWSSTKGLDIARATYLARLVDGEARLFAPGAPVSGLSLFVGVKPSGAVLARTEAGVLARRRER